MVQLVYSFLIAVVVLVSIGGCTGTHTFSQSVRSGETVTVGIGWRQDATKENTAVVITDAVGTVTRFEIGDSRIRAVVNLYPDPASKLVVGDETNQALGVQALDLGGFINNSSTAGDFDWSMTTVYFDLPDPMAIGLAKIDIEVNGESFAYTYPTASKNITVDIIGTGGTPYAFGIFGNDPGLNYRLGSLQRADHYVAYLNGTGAPWSLQATFTHDPDKDNGGVGKAFVVSTRGDRRNVSWSDDGTTLKVLVTPARINQLTKKDFKLTIAGGITGLAITNLQAFNAVGYDHAGLSYKFAPRITSVSPLGPYGANQPITITGEYLCDACVSPDPDVWVGSDGAGWQQATITSINSGALDVTLPATLPNGVIWLETPHGVDSVGITTP